MFPDLTCDDVFRLETPRLWLRWPRLSDASIISQIAGDKAISELTAKIPHPYPPDAAEAFVFQARRTNTNGQSLTLVVCPKSKPNMVIGVVGIFQDNTGEAPQIGYWLGLKYWGQGLMSEAVQAMVTTYFNLTKEETLVASTRLINPASQRILEKCGFVFEGEGMYESLTDKQTFKVKNYRLTRTLWRKENAEGIPFAQVAFLGQQVHRLPDAFVTVGSKLELSAPVS